MRRLIVTIACLLLVVPFGSYAQQLPPVNPATVSGDITITGSPILEPVTNTIATLFTLEGYTGNITVTATSTDEGFQALCSGSSDIIMTDRVILPQEVDACSAAGRPPLAFRVSTSAVVVSVASQNQFAASLTSTQLQQVFSTALTWSEVSPSWPDEAISRYGPPIDSAGFNLLVTTLYGGNRTPLVTAVGTQYSEDPGARLSEVASSGTAIGFFDAVFALNNSNVLRGVAIDGVQPTSVTVADNTYPLSRPLLIYATAQGFSDNPQVASFINYYLSNVEEQAAAEGLFPAPASGLSTARNRWLQASGQNASPTQASTQVPGTVIAPLPTGTEGAPIDDISATATALASVIDAPPTPTPAPQDDGEIFDVETQNLLIQGRLDLETAAEELLGSQRPEGWSGSLDIENAQLPLLVRLDLEILAANIFGIEDRPDGWFGAVSSTNGAIARDIRHDLELLADSVFGETRPIAWVGGEAIYSCDRSTQALADLLERNGLYTLTANPESPEFCTQVATEISRFVEINLLSSSVSIGTDGVSVPADVTIASPIAVAFYNTSATRRAGVIPDGTGIVPIARSYQGFSNMTLIEGSGFLLFVEWQNTSLTQDEWLALPNISDFEFETTCTERWCDA